ncbi:PIN domain nuclease [Streptomyces sp. H27-D2]|uniref:PIN domain nuclease n=1 Tax=Streptomyces sp. H27-D2 TaxID=3046304 RepID=UPI002DBB2AAF|nr:PIN domain nuclease [Streptomyces sp. H27-D2]MEC4014839.1 PIN domain nuclease [Streptomyces sp. H27-D2]
MAGAGADRFLIDTSAAARLRRPGVVERWSDELSQGRVGMCDPTEAELLFSARSVAECKQLGDRFAAIYTWHSVPEDAWQRAREMQLTLAQAGCHRSAGVVDLLVAVTALHHRLTLLHYDRDFETIARHTGLQTHWLAEPGAIA